LTVEVSLVDGVPVFWVPSVRPTLTASLIFRQGMVDETLPTSGWTHILEHSALHDREVGTLHVNGSTSLLHCSFDFHGPPDEVTEALTRVAEWLARPSLLGIEREKSVLAAESALRGSSATSEALA
jgi:predicted Zn-dependent peptidase